MKIIKLRWIKIVHQIEEDMYSSQNGGKESSSQNGASWIKFVEWKEIKFTKWK